MRKILFLLPLILLSCTTLHPAPPAQNPTLDRAAWMREARWGIFSHYLIEWRLPKKTKPTIEKWNDLVDHFDANALADQLAALHCPYYVLTIGQNSGYFCSPNSTYDELTGITPSHLSRRDLIADVATACHARGIHFMVYLPSGAPGSDKVAVAKLQWQNGPFRNQAFQRNWQSIIRTWSLRWGNKVDGWWFDGCYFPNSMYRFDNAPNFKSFADAARAGNPHALVAFNPGPLARLQSPTPEEDYIAGEVSDASTSKFFIARRTLNGKIDGVQAHILTYLGEKWGQGKPRYTDAVLAEFLPRIARTGTAITFDTPLTDTGLLSPDFLPQLTLIQKTITQTKLTPNSDSTTKPAPKPTDDENPTQPQ